MSVTGYGGWVDLNDTLHTLQYYDAAAATASTVWPSAYWGGLQDNGTTALLPGPGKEHQPAGGDGGMVLVNPSNAQPGRRRVHQPGDVPDQPTVATPSPRSRRCAAVYTGANCDPSARFIAPFQADVHDINHWVAAGYRVWDTRVGWNTSCSGPTCDWKAVHNFGKDAAGGFNLGTAVAVSGVTTYAAWVGSGGNPRPGVRQWHRHQLRRHVAPHQLPGVAEPLHRRPDRRPGQPGPRVRDLQRLLAPLDPGRRPGRGVRVARRWVEWRNISGNLPDAPGDSLALVNGKLVLGTDIGVFVAAMSAPQQWFRVAGHPQRVGQQRPPAAVQQRCGGRHARARHLAGHLRLTARRAGGRGSIGSAHDLSLRRRPRPRPR